MRSIHVGAGGLQRQLRGYFQELLDPTRSRSFRTAGVGPAVRGCGSRCARRWPGSAGPWSTAPGQRPIDQFIFFDEAMRAGARCHADHQHGRADHHELRHPMQKDHFLPSCCRDLHFCIGYSEPERGPTWLRSRPEQCATARNTSSTPEDVDQPGHRRRLLLAGCADQPGCQKAPRHLGHRGAMDTRHQGPALRLLASTTSTRCSTTTSASCRFLIGEENGAGSHHQQLNRERVTCVPAALRNAT